MLELATRIGSELDAVGAASSHTVLHKNILAHTVVAVTLKAICVIGRVDVAVAHDDIAAIHHVQTVIVPVALRVHGDALDQKITALVVLLVPTCRILKRDVLDDNVGAFIEMQVLWADCLIDTIKPERVHNQPHMNEVHETDSDFKATAVDHSFTCDADFVLINTKDKGCPLGVRILDVVVRIQGAEKNSVLLDVEGHVILQINGT